MPRLLDQQLVAGHSWRDRRSNLASELLARSLPCSPTNFTLSALAHHGHEFLEIDHTVPVRVDLIHDFPYSVAELQLSDVAALQNVLDVILRDLAIAVAVKQAEGRSDDILL